LKVQALASLITALHSQCLVLYVILKIYMGYELRDRTGLLQAGDNGNNLP